MSIGSFFAVCLAIDIIPKREVNALFSCISRKIKVFELKTGGELDTIRKEQEAVKMKGYSVGNGYMGLVNGRYMLFESEEAYKEYLED